MYSRWIFLVTCFCTQLFASEGLLRALTEVPGASGFEGPVRKIVYDNLKDDLFNLHTDGMGNLIGSRDRGPSKKPRVLLMAHMDEVGFLIREIDEKGFVYFDNVGGWVDAVVLEQKWVISTPKGPVIGITGVESPHVISGYPKVESVSQKRMFLDIGVSSKAEAEALGIRPGLPITPLVTFEELNGTDRYVAKAFDDRIGLAVIIETIRQLRGEEIPCEVVVAATVQEEVGTRGALVVYESTKPDIVLNIEIGIARDFPVLYPNHLSEAPYLGKGPTIYVYDGSMIPNNNLVSFMVNVAENHHIPFQYESQVLWYSQDGCRLQTSGNGRAAINLGVPTRYVHSPYGIVDLSDFDQLVQLLKEALREMTGEVVDSIHNFM